MHAVIAIPPVRDFYFTPHRFANLGAEIVSSILRQSGFKVTLFNFPLIKKKSLKIPLPPELDYLKPFIIKQEIGKLSFYKTYQHFGPSFTDCAQQIKTARSHILFITCFAFSYAREAMDLAAAVRRVMPQITIVAGGAGVSAHAYYFLREQSIDFCLSGEAEINLGPFLKLYGKKAQPEEFLQVPNLYFRENGKIWGSGVKEQTISEQLSFYIKKSYESKEQIYYSTCLSRGCTKSCSFCSLHLCHGRQFRTVALQKVINGIIKISPAINKSGKNVCINFEDDNLLLAADYFINVLKAIRKHIPGVKFHAENGLDYTLLNEKILKTLIELGLNQFNLSLATTKKATAQKENRVLKLKHFQNLLSIIQKYRLPCITYFICGLQGDTIDSIAHTLAYLAGLPTRSGISFFYAVPGITNFEDITLFDKISPVLGKASSVYSWNKSLTTVTMITAFRLSRFVNLLKGTTRPVEKDLINLMLKENKLYTLIKSRRGIQSWRLDNVDKILVSKFFKLLTLV